MLTIPPALDEAAEMDGATKGQLFWEVILPLARPGLITLGIFTFMRRSMTVTTNYSGARQCKSKLWSNDMQ